MARKKRIEIKPQVQEKLQVQPAEVKLRQQTLQSSEQPIRTGKPQTADPSV